MSITANVDHPRRNIYVRAEGRVSLKDIRSHLDEERSTGGLPYAELIDARGYSPDFSSEEVRTIVGILRSMGEESRLGPTAIVVDSDLGYGMLRMLGMLADDVCDIRPFRKQEEAEKWLSEFREDAV